MNATRVSSRAGRRSGLTLIAMLLWGCTPAPASEITLIVTGTLNGGNDYLGIFGMGRIMPAGTPYTLVYTFDDSKGQATQPGCSGSGIGGAHQNSPGIAVLTIAGKSYTFGRRPDAISKAWRLTASGCSTSEIGMEIGEGQFPLFSNVSIRIAPQGAQSLTQNSDWRSALSVSNVYARNTYNSFMIWRPGNNMISTQSYLSVSSVTVSGPKAARPIELRATAPAPKPVNPQPNPPVALRPVSGAPASTIYVMSTIRGNKITAYGADGKPSGPRMGCACTSIAVDAAGKIYATNNWRETFLMFLPDGTKITPSLRVGGGSVTLDADGTIYLLDGDAAGAVIKGFTPTGTPTGLVIHTKTRAASGLARDASGRFYVAFRNINVVKPYDAMGQPTTPTLSAGLTAAKAVAVGPDGRIYVANALSVATFLPNGQRTAPTITSRNSEGGFAEPSALAVDAGGWIYVGYYSVGWRHGKAEVYGPDGALKTTFLTEEGVRGIAVH